MAIGGCLLIIATLFTVGALSFPFVQYEYHNYEALTSVMTSLADSYQSKTHLYSIGKTVQGRDLWVMAIAGDKPDKIVPRRPDVKYVGNMHGNEVIGREILLHFIEYLLVNYDDNVEVRTFLNNTRVHILPSMNPDGFEVAIEGECTGVNGRYNAMGFDLNRNFPDYFEPAYSPDRQPETQAIIDWVRNNQFVLSANLHGGALLANYPFDNLAPGDFPVGNSSPYSRSPDDSILREISLVYSQNHPRMHLMQENRCDGDEGEGFVDGITNGADWYPATGVMQDYNYIFSGCMELTLELSCCKYPNVSNLQGYWEENRQSMLAYLQQVHRGVKGIVTDIDTDEPIEGALVSISGQADPPNPSSTTAFGEYWKLLPAGDYTVQVSKPGYTSNTSRTVNVRAGVGPEDVITLDLSLVASSAALLNYSMITVSSLLFSIVSIGR